MSQRVLSRWPVALLVLMALACTEQETELRSQLDFSVRRPDILIYLVDTLRPDRLGCYDYGRPTSPNIDAFAAQATLFENAIAQSSWTRASMASIFTGVWPPTHRTTGWKHQLPDSFATLSEVLDAAGYETAAFVGNPQISRHYGFSQGFDHFDRKVKRPSPEYNQMALEWLDGRQGEAPRFLYIHTMDPHAPYQPPEPYLSQFAPNYDEMPSWKPRWKWPPRVAPFMSDRYDGEVAQNDASFGELLRALEERGLFDDSLIVFTSDHGEEFREHGQWRHGANLHRETLNVPLIVRFPRQQSALRVRSPVQHIDIMPTLLDYLGLEIPAGIQGSTMLDLERSESGIYSHLFLSGSPLYYSLVEGDWKLIRAIDSEGRVTHQLYHRGDDPGETVDLAEAEPARTAAMAARLDAKLAAEQEREAAEELPIPEEMQEELEALGYLQ